MSKKIANIAAKITISLYSCVENNKDHAFSNSFKSVTYSLSWFDKRFIVLLLEFMFSFNVLSTNHESLSQPIMKIGYWLHYFFHFSFCLTIVLGRIKFDCTLEDLHPVCQRKWFALEHSILSHLLWIARVAKSVLSRANLLPIL